MMLVRTVGSTHKKSSREAAFFNEIRPYGTGEIRLRRMKSLRGENLLRRVKDGSHFTVSAANDFTKGASL